MTCPQRGVFQGNWRTEDCHDAIASKALNDAALLAHGVIHQLRKAAHVQRCRAMGVARSVFVSVPLSSVSKTFLFFLLLVFALRRGRLADSADADEVMAGRLGPHKQSLHFRLCAGFWMPVNTMAATRLIGRRPKSAKARNRDRSCAGGAAHAMGI
jgi:hypothetical protein